MQNVHFKLPKLYDSFVHFGSFSFKCVLLYGYNLHLKSLFSECNFNNIALFDVIRGFYNPAVDAYTLSVTSFICNGSALYEARHFKIFIKSHILPFQKQKLSPQ